MSKKTKGSYGAWYYSRMVERYSYRGVTWVSLKRPTREEVEELMIEFDLSPFLMSDLTAPVPQNSAVVDDGVIKVTLDFPVIKQVNKQRTKEIKFLIAKQTLITVQYDEMGSMDRFRRAYEIRCTLKKPFPRSNAIQLFIEIFNELYTAASNKLDYLESVLGDIENHIFDGNEKKMVLDISQASKKLISFKHTLRSHDTALADLAELTTSLYKKTYEHDLEKLTTRYEHLIERSGSLFEILVALRDTNLAMLTTKQNEIMKTLTIMAFITFPLTLFTQMFGMNTESTPILGLPGDFWIIVAIMFGVTLILFAYFKRKGWM